MICQALSDVRRSRGEALSAEARDAMRFFYDGRMDTVAEVIGIEPDFVREIAGKCGVRDPGQASAAKFVGQARKRRDGTTRPPTTCK